MPSTSISPLKTGTVTVPPPSPSKHVEHHISVIPPRQTTQKITSNAVFYDLFNELYADVPSSRHLTSFFTSTPLRLKGAVPRSPCSSPLRAAYTVSTDDQQKHHIFAQNTTQTTSPSHSTRKITQKTFSLHKKQHTFTHKTFRTQVSPT